MSKNYTWLALIGVIFSFNAQAQNRYVSNSGTDIGNCDLPGSPCETIEYAVGVTTTNDTVFVAPGDYSSDAVTINLDGVVLTALDATDQPVIEASELDLFTVTAPNVTISNLTIEMGLIFSGKRGIIGEGNFNNILIENNNIVSTATNGIWTPNSMVFDAYAILLQADVGVPTQATVRNNTIGPADANKATFGRGLGLGFNNSGVTTPSGDFSDNQIVAYYPIQAIRIDGALSIENNHFYGITMINSPSNGANVLLNNNTFDAVNDQVAAYLYSVLDIRAFNDGDITVSNCNFVNYGAIGLLSMASRNVEVLNNTFSPSSTATDFISLVANTKLMTAGNQNNSYSDGIIVKGNLFNSAVANEGTAMIFADHYGQNTPAFDVTEVGGPTPIEWNVFDTSLKNYIVLDSSSGSSDNIPLWSATNTPETIMQPVTQDVEALFIHNTYGLLTEAECEEKNIDSLDASILGKVILGDLSTAGIGTVSFSKALIYPNPAQEKVSIRIQDLENVQTVSILDYMGRSIMQTEPTMNESEFTLDCSILPRGTYLIVVESDMGQFTAPFIKE